MEDIPLMFTFAVHKKLRCTISEAIWRFSYCSQSEDIYRSSDATSQKPKIQDSFSEGVLRIEDPWRSAFSNRATIVSRTRHGQ